MIKLIFMGTTTFSVEFLDGLFQKSDYEILAVVTQPDRLVGRKKEIKWTPVKELARAYNIPVYQPEKLSLSPELMTLMNLGADGIVTAAFGQFLPECLLKSVDFSVNVHASLLPKYRGGSPIHHAIMNGDKDAGVTIIEMVKEMDAGDMISSRSIPILDSDNVGTMFEKLAFVGRELLLDTLPAYIAGDILLQEQDPGKVTFARNISPQEEKIDWRWSARSIFNKIRGMNPFPVAYSVIKGNRFKIYESEIAEGEGNPGEIIVLDKHKMLVATGQGALSLKVVQPAGKSKMLITDYLNGLGRHLTIGEKFD